MSSGYASAQASVAPAAQMLRTGCCVALSEADQPFPSKWRMAPLIPPAHTSPEPVPHIDSNDWSTGPDVALHVRPFQWVRAP